MKSLGLLDGAELLLDTDDEQVFELASKDLEEAWKKLYPIMTDDDYEREITGVTKNFYNFLDGSITCGGCGMKIIGFWRQLVHFMVCNKHV